MADTKDWRYYSKYHSSSNQGSNTKSEESSNQSSRYDDWRKYSKLNASAKISENITTRVNSWLNNHNSYVSDYQKRFSGRKGTSEDAYVNDSASWLNSVTHQKINNDTEAKKILEYMDQYKDYLDADWMDNVRNAITGVQADQQSIYDIAVNDNQWWSNFKDEEDYNFWQHHNSAESRQKWYAEQEDKLEQLKAEKDKDEDIVSRRAEELYKTGKYTSMLHATEDALKEYNDEIAAIEADLRNYELGNFYNQDGTHYGAKVVDDYSAYIKKPDFSAVSSNRNIVNPTRTDLDEYDNLRDSSTWDYDENGILRDAKGNEIRQDASGKFVNPKANDYAVKDRLGIYLGATDDEREEYAGTIVSGTWGDIIGQGIEGSWDQLEEDEIKIYYYLLNKEGKESADKYLSDMRTELNRRETEEKVKQYAQEYEQANFLGKVAMNAATVPSNLLGGIAGAAENASHMIRGEDINPYSSAHTGSHYSNTVRGEAAKDLDATGIKIPGLDFTLGDAYQAGMSILDSFAAIGIGGQFGGALLATNAANSEATRLYEQGATKEQIALGSAAAGAAEMIFESLSIDKLINMKDAKTVGQIIKNALVQGGVEASEEGFTEIANILTNSIIMGDQSDWNKLVEKYNGDTFSAFMEKVKDVVNASLSGFISGVGSSAGPSTVSYAANKLQQNADAKQRYGDNQAGFVEESLMIDADNAYAKKLQSKLKDGKDLSGRQLRKLEEKNASTLKKRLASSVQETAKKRLTDLGEKENVDNVAKLVSKLVMDEEMTRSERSTLARSQFGSKVAKDIKENGLEYESPATYKSLEDRVGTESKFNVSKSGQATIQESGEAFDIKKAEVVSFTTDKATGDVVDVTFKTDDGTEVQASGIDFEDNDQSHLVEAVSNIENITPKDAQAIIRDYDPSSGQTVSEYLNGMDEGFTYGYHGYSVEDLKAGNFAPKLSSTQMMSAYELGKAARRESTTASDAPKVKMRTAAEAKLTAEQKLAQQKASIESNDVEVYFQDGKSVVKFDEHGGKYDDKRMAAVNTAKFLSKLKIGGKYYFFESYVNKAGDRVYKDSDGNEVAAPNGMFKDSDGSIHIDLNAGDAGNGIALFTLGHELTHFIKAQSKSQFKILCDLVKEAFDKTELSMRERVLEKQKFLKNVRGEDVSYDEAYEEVVADAMSTMITDGNFHEKLMEIRVKHKDLFNTIKRFFDKMIAEFKKVYEKLTPDQKDARDIREVKDMFDKIQTAFAEALVEASDNFQAAIEAEAVESLGENAKVETNANGELLLASNERGNVLVYSERTYHEGGRAKLELALRQNGHTETEINQTLSYVDDALDYIKILAAGYAQNMGYTNLSDHLVADIITNVKTGKQVMSAIVNNGDYPVNIDLSLICKKRVAYMNLMSRLIRDGVFDKVNYDGAAIAEVNEILRANNFETACLGCFVESRRLQFQTWAETIVSEWNSEVEKRNPNAGSFGFAKGKMENLTDADIDALTRELESVKKNDQGNVNLGQGNSVTRMGRLLDALPSLQKKLTVEDLLTPEGLTALRKHDGSLFSIVKSRYGAASPKIVQDFNPYASEIAMLTFAHVKSITNNAVKGAQAYVAEVKSEYGKLKKDNGESKTDFNQRKKDHEQRIQDEAMRRYLYDIGGARIQSFSDFMIENIFDYIQIFADLSAKRLPLHGYSKEIVCLRLFGMTGAKWNGSLIAHVERNMGKEYAGLLPAGTKDGIPVSIDGKDYVIGFDDYARNAATGGKSFVQSIGMKDIIALQLDPRYSPYVGNITIGVSDKQILAMLDSPLFRMVIPYHASGMLPMFAKLVGVDMYNDYTDYQNTTVRQYYDLDGNAVSELKNAKGEIVKADTSYAFNAEIQKTKDAKIAANNYLKWCAQRHEVYDGSKLVGYATFNPKFSSSPYGTDFTRHENYYKLLEDFNTYDCLTEASTVQGAVTMNFPSEANRLTAQQMEAYKEALRETGIFTEKDIEKYAKKADMTFKEIIAAEVGNRANYAATQAPKWESTVKAVEEKLQRDYARDEKRSDRNFTYHELTAKSDLEGRVIKASQTVKLTSDGSIDKAWVVSEVLKQCESIQTKAPLPTYFVNVPDIRKNVEITGESIRHGFIKSNAKNGNSAPTRSLLNARASLDLPHILQNSIEVNRSDRGDNAEVEFSHILIGVTAMESANGKTEYYVVRSVVESRKNQGAILTEANVIGKLHAINAKKIGKPHAQVGTNSTVALTHSSLFAYSVADLLNDVKNEFNDTFSNDVYKHFGMTRKGNKFSNNLMFSERGEGSSNRSLLANAFEGIVRDSVEYKQIQKYKANVDTLNVLERQLSDINEEIRLETDAKKRATLQEKAERIANDINKQDKVLLNLEASEPLRKVIERERKKEAQNVKEHVNEIVQNKKLRAEQTELRHKIRKTIRDLDKILNRGNKNRNVKEDLQPVVTKALQAAEILFTENYGNYDMLRNGIGADLSDAEEALVATCARMLRELDKMPTDGYDNFMARQEAENRLKSKMYNLKDVFARERKRLNNTKVSSILGELADAYASLEESDQSYVQGAYSEPVHTFLKNLQNEVGGTIVHDMTKDQLESVYAAYKMVLTTVRKANQLFNDNIKMSREQIGNAVIKEVLKAGGVHLLGTKMGDAISQADWNNMKPIWVANRIGSESFAKLMQGLFEGQYNFAVDINEVKQFKLSMDKKYNPRNWDAEKLYQFESSTGKEFNLNLQQIMSLYAFSKREQAYSHLLNGGFVFEDNSTVVVDGKLGIKKTYIHKGATSYKLNEDTLNSIINSLTDEQKAYVDEMQKYLSDVMGAKGNEVSMQLYGIKMFNEEFYFPLRSSGAYMERAKEAELKKQQGQINLVNSGFTHSVKPQAKNPIILSDFMDVWAEHCNEMSMYHSMVLPMEDFRKVYNYSTIHDEQSDSASVQQTIQDAYGDAATKYIDQLYKELNAGATVDPRETPWKKLISNFKKTAVMLSGSVVVQQFSSIGRSFAIIDPKYFVGAKVNSDTKLSSVEEMKKYAPVAIIKEMGGFDTGTKGNAKAYILAEKYGEGDGFIGMWKDSLHGKGERIKGLVNDEQYRGDIMGYLPAKADEKTWCAIWEAAKRETKANYPQMDVKSEEFLKLAGERFSEVIEKTQVYDSVLARSANMRSKGNFMAMATAFMAEPTTTVNLLEDAIRRGNKKYIARAFGSVAVAIVLNNALASLVYAMRDDDEDETFIEKYFQSFTSGMIDDINPMTYYPFLKDVYSLFQGYDVERTDMSVIADLRDALKKTISVIGKDTSNMDDDKLAEHYKTVNSAILSLLDAGCSYFGAPVKNIRREVNGIINAWNTIDKDISGERNATWRGFWDKVGSAAKDTIPIYAWTKDKSKQDKLYEAIISGDKTYVSRLKAGYKDDAAYNSAVRKALRENDPRIHEAAQARYNGNIAECKRIYNEIKNEGKFNSNDILEAINSEESKIRNEGKHETVSSSYSSTDFVNAVIVGDTRLAATMKDDIISAKVANGKSQEEAEESFATYVSSATRDAFDSSLLNEAGAKKMLREYADMGEDEAASKVTYWSVAKSYPQYRDDLSEARVEKYNEFAKPAGISLDVFVQYLRGTSGIETKYDKWGDVEESVRDQVLAVIDSLPITWEQKDALYLAAGYAESKIWDVPW